MGKNMITSARQTVKKFKNGLCYRAIINNEPINMGIAVFTSRNGTDLSGNMLRLILELKKADKSMEIYVPAVSSKKDYIRNLLDRYGLNDVTVLKYDSIGYFKYLETAGYIFCDSSLPLRYVKRNGQIYINTWHGTPYKMMGNDSRSDRAAIANVQRNLAASDCLVFSSDYSRDRILGPYSMVQLYGGSVLMTGAPCNDIFFDAAIRDTVKERYHLSDKRVYVYMPTFRESESKDRQRENSDQTLSFLKQIDMLLNENEVMYVRLHPFEEKGINYSGFTSLRPFPDDMDPYEFITSAECLVSDYSSVIYDFANSRRKIVRFAYDEDDYKTARGVYDQPVPMPFPVVRTAEELIAELRTEKKYDDTEFVNCFCRYESGHSSEDIISAILERKLSGKEVRKDLTLYYNESITPLPDMESIIPAGAENDSAYLAFARQALEKDGRGFDNIPDGIGGVIGISLLKFDTAAEALAMLIKRKTGTDSAVINDLITRFRKREAARLFTGYPFRKYVYCNGKDPFFAEITENMMDR